MKENKNRLLGNLASPEVLGLCFVVLAIFCLLLGELHSIEGRYGKELARQAQETAEIRRNLETTRALLDVRSGQGRLMSDDEVADDWARKVVEVKEFEQLLKDAQSQVRGVDGKYPRER